MRLVATKVTEGGNFQHFYHLFSNSSRHVEYAHSRGKVFWAFYIIEEPDEDKPLSNPIRNQGILNLSDFNNLPNQETIEVSRLIPPMKVDPPSRLIEWRKSNAHRYEYIQNIQHEYVGAYALVS